MPRRVATLILLFLLVMTTTACLGGDDDDSSDASASPTREVTVDQVLEAGRKAWADTQSARFTLDINGDAYLDENQTVKLISAEGDIKRPGSVAATARIDAQISVIDVSLVAVDGQIFITNFLSGNWEKAPDDFTYDPSILFSDTDGIGPIMTDLQNPQLDGTEDINGRQAYKVNGTIAADRVAKITAGTIAGQEINVTLWTSVDDAKLLRVVLTEPEGVRESPATWTLNLSDHGKEIEIEAPPVPTRTS